MRKATSLSPKRLLTRKRVARTHASVVHLPALRAYVEFLWQKGGIAGPLSVNRLSRELSFAGIQVPQASLSRVLSGVTHAVSGPVYQRLRDAPSFLYSRQEIAGGCLGPWHDLLALALAPPEDGRARAPLGVGEIPLRELTPAETASFERAKRGSGRVELETPGRVRVPDRFVGSVGSRAFTHWDLKRGPNTLFLLDLGGLFVIRPFPASGKTAKPRKLNAARSR